MNVRNGIPPPPILSRLPMQSRERPEEERVVPKPTPKEVTADNIQDQVVAKAKATPRGNHPVGSS